ncbi:WD40-repeat-containing domain protein [Amylostereum chailletii]|nr:WD40-repeat-containing domain protein [Amylostereum chailletii]
MPGRRVEYRVPGYKFEVAIGLRVIVASDSTVTSSPRPLALSSGSMLSKAYPHKYTTGSQAFHVFSKIKELRVRITSSEAEDMEVSMVAGSDASKLESALSGLSSEALGPNLEKLCIEVDTLLQHVLDPENTPRLHSELNTVEAILDIAVNALEFVISKCKPAEFPGPRPPDREGETDLNRILKEFTQQIAILRRNFDEHKDVELFELYAGSSAWSIPSPSVARRSTLYSSFESGVYLEDQFRPASMHGDSSIDHTQVFTVQREAQLLGRLEFLDPRQHPSAFLWDYIVLEGTRSTQLSEISTWMCNISELEPNVLLLLGGPGTGKTSIARHVWTDLKKRHNSSVALFLTDDYADDPERIWPAIALAMAKMHPAFRESLCRSLDSKSEPEDLFNLENITATFQISIVDPLLNAEGRLVEQNSSIVVIIDGLDRCSRGTLGWQALVKSCTAWASLLPSCFKLLVTSRPLSFVSQTLSGTANHIGRLELHSGGKRSDTDNKDITRFLEVKLSELAPAKYWTDGVVALAWPSPRVISKLTQVSAGSFAWAQEIVNKLRVTSDQDKDGEIMNIVTSGPSAKYGDELYKNTLKFLFHERFPLHFTYIVGSILVSKKPPTISLLKAVTNDNYPSEELCRTLLPLLYIDEEERIELRHSSFAFYITDPKRCDPKIAVNRAHSNDDMALACFRIMRDELKFNVCGLESSYTPVVQADIPRITAAISPELAYASEFWADHMQIASARDQREPQLKADDTSHTRASHAVDLEGQAETLSRSQKDDKILKQMDEFFLQNRWLYWLEVMSALALVDHAPRLLAIAAAWLKSRGSQELSDLATEASRFVSMFRDAIAFSPAHLYLSALPFFPHSSPLYQQISHRLPNIFLPLNHEGDMQWWSPLVLSFMAVDPELRDYPTQVRALALSSDGKRVAVASPGDATVRIFNVDTGILVIAPHASEYERQALAVAFSGKRVVAGFDNGNIRVWDSETGAQLGETFQAHTNGIRGLSMSPDGSQLVSGSDDSTIRIIDLTTMKLAIDIFKGHTDCVRSVAWTADGRFIISGSDDRTVCVWDKAAGVTVGNPMVGHSDCVRTVIADGSSRYIASGGDDNAIYLWSLEQKIQIHKLWRHTDSVRALAFSSDGDLLVSGSDDCSIIVWDVSTGHTISSPLTGHSFPVTSLCVFPGAGRLVLSGSEDGSLKRWDISHLSANVPLPAHGGPGIVTACMPDGETVACTDGHRYWKWNLRTGSSFGGYFIDQSILAVTFLNISPNGQFAAIATSHGTRVYDMSTGERLSYDSLGEDAVGGVAFSFDGKKLVTITRESQSLFVWDVPTGSLLSAPMDGPQTSISQVVFSPSGSLVASCADDNSVCIWDIRAGTTIHGLMEGHTDSASSVAFSPDERYLASCAGDNMIIIWDVQSGAQAFQHSTGLNERSFKFALAWSPDCQQVAIGGLDPVIHLLDIKTGQISAEFVGHRGAILHLEFSLDGRRLISSDADDTVRVWDTTPMMSRMLPLRDDHMDWVHSVAISPDGSLVASGGDDNRVSLRRLGKAYDRNSRIVLEEHEDWIVCTLFTHDGKYLITGSYDGSLRIWDRNMPDPRQLSVHQNKGLRALAISPTSLQIAWALADNTIRLYDIDGDAKLTHVQTLHGHSSVADAVAYFPNEPSHIVSGARDGTLCIWDISREEASVGPFVAHAGSTLAVAVTPDGSCIVSAGEDGKICLWDAKTGDALLPVLVGHSELVHCIHVSQDGSQIISGSRDETIRIWDRASGEQLCPPLRGHKGAVLALAVSADEKLLVSGGADHTVALWNVDFTREMRWPEVSEHTMVGSVSVCATDNEGMIQERADMEDGWVTHNSDKLFWVPPPLRKGLCLPPQVGILGAPELYIDFRNFVHGKEWTRCHR